VSIETIEAMPDSNEQAELAATQAEALDRLSMLIQRLKPLDRKSSFPIWKEWMRVRSVNSPGYRRPTSL
jgi:hypothetical protein